MYADIGGMDIQKQEVREAVELPLTHFELYKQVRYAKEFGAWFKLGVNEYVVWARNFIVLFLNLYLWNCFL